MDANEIELMSYLNVLWKRKWLIILPAFFCITITGIISFLTPAKWKVDAIILPSKFLLQTEIGHFEEIVITSPRQIAEEIKNFSYDKLISNELNLDIKKFPKIKAENIRETNLIHVSVVERDVEKAKLILSSLFTILKRNLDMKVEVQMKSLETEIENNENYIKTNKLIINDNLNEIKLHEIEKNKIKQVILSAGNKLQISIDREKNIIEEMKTVKKRIDAIEEQQKNYLSEKNQDKDVLSLLLYSNEIQTNLRYYNSLDEKLSNERITQENINLLIKEKEEEIKQNNTRIERLNNQIEKVKNEIKNIETEINFLKNKKAQIDYAKFVKAPTSSISPISPKKTFNILIAGIMSIMVFSVLAFFLEYVEMQKRRRKRPS